jgi:hypothetical protein
MMPLLASSNCWVYRTPPTCGGIASSLCDAMALAPDLVRRTLPTPSPTPPSTTPDPDTALRQTPLGATSACAASLREVVRELSTLRSHDGRDATRVDSNADTAPRPPPSALRRIRSAAHPLQRGKNGGSTGVESIDAKTNTSPAGVVKATHINMGLCVGALSSPLNDDDGRYPGGETWHGGWLGRLGMILGGDPMARVCARRVL